MGPPCGCPWHPGQGRHAGHRSSGSPTANAAPLSRGEAAASTAVGRPCGHGHRGRTSPRPPGPAARAGSATRIQGYVTGVTHPGHRGVCLASPRTCANPTPDPPVRWPKVESYIVRAAAAAPFRFLFLPVWQKKRYFCISARCCWVSFSPDLSENTSSLQGKTHPR